MTHPAADAEFLRVAAAKAAKRSEAQNWAKRTRTSDDGSPLTFVPLATQDPNGVGWRINSAYAVLDRVGASIVEWEAAPKGDDPRAAEASRAHKAIVKSRPRNLLQVPSEPGLCLPYLFIPDDGRLDRAIATTYRLKAHPDITIWLQDSNGGPVPKGADPDKFTARYDNQFFWDQNYRDRKKTRLLDHDRLKLAGIEGEYSVMELTRPDDTIDYGFFASARDDASKVPDPTNIQMFVIRDSKNAAAKGIKPMPKDEFIKFARTIAASVKMRPTQQ